MDGIEYEKEVRMIIDEMARRRIELGLSQRALGAKCGIPQSSIARLEAGKNAPNLSTILIIARELGLKLSLRKQETG